ncbi:DUF3299 domain-containing protein [Denitrificimonas sp. JX-1]|uniref:DUF3299 domain-containing protein n=1 Tax=Denitrificimonas halotolerans TaxID=3098930 RepID=A0ABU5GRV0_9GAMM|nr:DUF3299 domain-containing protein [Denitrificimonas sp. JX-1]MDY7219716.1 DUF3299 domain-containing protein [Denitrificimonas sp. JX-1]
MLLLASTVPAALEETDWLELLPESDLQALLDMPEISHNTPEADSSFYAPERGGLRASGEDLPAVMYSAQTVPELDGRAILLGGYPVPLESNGKGNFVEFFLVPYPGACIHVPPPPPNQIVLVRYPQGMPLEDIYAPLWVEGTLNIELSSNELADAAYTIAADKVELVEY